MNCFLAQRKNKLRNLKFLLMCYFLTYPLAQISFSWIYRKGFFSFTNIWVTFSERRLAILLFNPTERHLMFLELLLLYIRHMNFCLMNILLSNRTLELGDLIQVWNEVMWWSDHWWSACNFSWTESAGYWVWIAHLRIVAKIKWRTERQRECCWFSCCHWLSRRTCGDFFLIRTELFPSS